VSVDTAWRFFSDPRNLAAITPPQLGFELRSSPPPEIYPGLMIVYRVRPLVGIPVTWVTEITHVTRQDYFIDEQRSGPYRIWHHEHHFTEKAGGTLVSDQVKYAVIGRRLIQRLLVGHAAFR